MQIQLEGCEASGKSTLLNNLKVHYQNLGYLVTSAHFPSKTSPFGCLAHDILSGMYKVKDANFLITLLSIADQKVYNDKYINIHNNPKLLNITSRGLLSTLVYSDLHAIELTKYTQSICILLDCIIKPDIVIYLKPTVETVTERLARRTTNSIYDKTKLIKVIQDRYDIVMDWLEPKLNIFKVDIQSDTSPTDLIKICTNYINSELCRNQF